MTEELYYETPSDVVFEEVKRETLKIFKEITGQDSSYYENKKNEIEKINNIKDNIMFIITKLSWNNLEKLGNALTKQTKEEIRKRLESVNAYEMIYFKTKK